MVRFRFTYLKRVEENQDFKGEDATVNVVTEEKQIGTIS